MSRPFRASRNLAPFPRALPWAGMSRPFRAATNFVALSVTLSPLSKAAGKAHAKARKREEWEPRIHANSREFTQNGVSGWSKRAVKSEFKSFVGNFVDFVGSCWFSLTEARRHGGTEARMDEWTRMCEWMVFIFKPRKTRKSRISD